MKYIFTLLIGLSIPLIGMETKSKGLGNPYIMAAGLSAVSYYAPSFVEAALPEGSVVPHIIKYGGYATAAYLASFGYTNPLEAKKSLGNKALAVGKLALNATPAILCHPIVAHTVSNACMTFAQPRVSSNTSQLMQSYLPATCMAAAGCASAYLINRNIITPGQAYKKTAELAHDAKPFSFIAPTLVAFKADQIKNYIMQLLPEMHQTRHDKASSLIKNTILVASAAGAAHLFATQFLGLATQAYIKNEMNKLMTRLSALTESFRKTRKDLEYVGSSITRADHAAADQLQTLLTFSEKTDNQLAAVQTLHTNVAAELKTTDASIAIMNSIMASAAPTVKKLHTEIDQAIIKLEKLKEVTNARLTQVPVKADAETLELSQLIQKHRQTITEQINVLRMIHDDQTSDLNGIKANLNDILVQMRNEKQALQESLDKIAKMKTILEKSAATIAELGKHTDVTLDASSTDDGSDVEELPNKGQGSSKKR